MFTAKLNILFQINDKIIVRSLRNRRLPTTKPNPGLDRRVNAFQKEGLQVQLDDAEEFIESSESDFRHAGEAYNEHKKETLKSKYDLRHHIVKEKYFKDNMPNLLTWSEKEQIRLLASSASDDWTPQKIAESFPVTEHVVKKLLKYPWKPASQERIDRHDTSTLRNWKELKEGTLDIPEDLRKHFLKFVDRSIPPLSKQSIKIDITQEQKIGEFQSIVNRCAGLESNENIKQESKAEIPQQAEQPKPKKDNTRLTLTELKDRIKRRLDSGNDINMNDKIIIKSVQSESSNTSNITEYNKQIELQEYDDKKKNNSIKVHKDREDSETENTIMKYPERIRIPKNVYKKGATYKINDCYYDHDGKFLYRVLGMSQ